jgi:hypothetical protein
MEILLQPLDGSDNFLINLGCTTNKACNTVAGCGCPIKTEP